MRRPSPSAAPAAPKSRSTARARPTSSAADPKTDPGRSPSAARRRPRTPRTSGTRRRSGTGGHAFEREISASLRAQGFHFIKIATTSAVGTGTESRFMKSPPYDHYAISGRIYGLEEKCWSGDRVTRLEFGRVAEHQVAGLVDLEASSPHAVGVILVNLRQPKNRAWAIRITDWLALQQSLAPRQSIPIAALDSLPFIPLERTRMTWTEPDPAGGTRERTGPVWDLSPLHAL